MKIFGDKSGKMKIKMTHTRLVATLMIIVSFGSLMTSAAETKCPEQLQPFGCKCNYHEEPKKLSSITCTKAESNVLRDALMLLPEDGTTYDNLRILHTKIRWLPGAIALGSYAKSISFNYCNLSKISENAFDSLEDKLQVLELISNNLKKVPQKSIKGLKNLHSLRLQFNKIEQLRSGDFVGLHSLVQLNLFGNRIVQVASEVFDNSKLNNLNLGNNMLQKIMFPDNNYQLPNLEQLGLEKNRISTIDSEKLQYLGNSLRNLDLSRNKLEKLTKRFAEYLSNLETLNLEQNSISHINEEAFLGIEETLTSLTLSNNSFKEIPTMALKRLNKLTHLKLDYNGIKRLKSETFQNFGITLINLHVQNNKISKIDEDTFKNMTELTGLFLGNNEIKTLNIKTFGRLMPKLKTFELKGNPLNCDCKMVWFAALIRGNLNCTNANEAKIVSDKKRIEDYLPSCNETWVSSFRIAFLSSGGTIVAEKYNNVKCSGPRALVSKPIANVQLQKMVCEPGKSSAMHFKVSIPLLFLISYLVISS